MTDREFETVLSKLYSPEFNSKLSHICKQFWPEIVSWDANKMEFTATFDITEDMSNPAGWLHGGAMATMLDNGMGVLATIISGGCMVPTVSLNVSYLRPAPLMGKVIMKASIPRAGQNIVHTSAQLFWETEENMPFASATAVFAVLKDVKII